jgi:hypothetical protein
LRWFKNAVIYAQLQSEAANDLANALDPKMVQGWKDMVDAWLDDQSCPDPYEEREEGMAELPGQSSSV